MSYFEKTYHPPGTSPGTLVSHEGADLEETSIHLIDYTDSEFIEKKLASTEECQPYLNKDSVTWIHLQGPMQADTLKNIGNIFQLHPLTLEDVLNKGQRPKVEEYADRPIISRPYTPFYLMAGEEVTVYVSTPLWLELSVGSKSKKLLEEIAIQRPSDTWFGPSTREGELCYASSTHCRLDLEELPQRPYRAITPVHICNKADTTLAVERLNVPATLLPLYASSKGQLWTPRITLIREKDGDMAELVIDNKPPKEAVRAVKLSEPRETVDEGVLFRAFNAVFS